MRKHLQRKCGHNQSRRKLIEASESRRRVERDEDLLVHGLRGEIDAHYQKFGPEEQASADDAAEPVLPQG
jgi:hypothetical protein